MARRTSSTDRPRLPAVARGFTLAESAIAAAVLALSVVAVLGPISASYQQTRAARETQVASSLIRQMFDEISARPFADPNTGAITVGPQAGETGRSSFDDVGDYDGFTDTTDALKTLGGAPVTLAGPNGTYTRKVSVERRTGPAGPAAPTGDFALVTVKVTTPSGQIIQASRLCAKYPRGS